MDWQEIALKPSGRLFHAEVGGGLSWQAFAADVVRFASDVIERYQRAAWDTLFVEYWGEGRVLLIPAHSATDARIDDVCLDLTFLKLREQEALSDSVEENERERRADEMLSRLEADFAIPVGIGLGVPMRFRPYGEDD